MLCNFAYPYFGVRNDEVRKVHKVLERILKVSEIKMSVDKVLSLAKTITTIQIRLPLNKDTYTQTMLMARHQKIAKLFDEDFWVTRWRSQKKGMADFYRSNLPFPNSIIKGHIKPLFIRYDECLILPLYPHSHQYKTNHCLYQHISLLDLLFE